MGSGDGSGRIRPVILCGGGGTRLWPVSRASMPKPFQVFRGERTLLQDTAVRVAGPLFSAPAFAANEEHRFLVADQAEAVGVSGSPILLEPVGRNTAAAALAASLLVERDGGGLVLLLPSDHLIADPVAFREAVLTAAPAAEAGAICLFGIRPTRPETGYGYIEIGSEPVPDRDSPVREVVRFVEKPDAPRAAAMIASGRFAWNAGIFLFRASTMLAEAAERQPALLAGAREAFETMAQDGRFLRLGQAAFARLPAISLDYALIEGSRRTAVLPTELAWSDLGAWDAVAAAHAPDADGNVVLGRAVAIETRRSFVRSEGPLVATLGVEGLVVVATADAVLVADAARAQAVREILDRLRAAGHGEADAHAETHRPWGAYRTLVSGERFQVKIISVKPGGRLSLQRHHGRAEHWVVVRGRARITCGERVFELGENQSTYIPQGETHRLENPGDAPLELIEVQSGAHIAEDDIVRLDDVYGRA